MIKKFVQNFLYVFLPRLVAAQLKNLPLISYSAKYLCFYEKPNRNTESQPGP